MDELTPFPSPVDAGQFAWFDSLNVVAERPGKLLELVKRPFVVTRPWPDFGPQGEKHRPVLLSWQPGTKGSVVAIQFYGSKWTVMVELDDVQRAFDLGLGVDEAYPEIPLQMFLRCTAALEAYRAPLFPEAANDP